MTQSQPVDPNALEIFGSNIAPPIILAASIFSIFWGILNAIKIRQITMQDSAPIRQALEEAGVEVDEGEASPEGVMGTDDDVVKRSPTLILARINWIGEQITSGAIRFLN